jgi:hypothetical protein
MKAQSRSRTIVAAAALSAMLAIGFTMPGLAAVDDEAAYDAAVAAGTPSALRDFILQHPDSEYAELAFDLLNKLCAQDGESHGCNIEDLVLPAAGPNTTSSGPQNDGGSRGNASPG